MASLEHSVTGIPHPTDWKIFTEDFVKPLLNRAGVKSWKAFMNGATLCCIGVDSETTNVEAFRRTGKSFEPLPDTKVSISTNAPFVDIGKIVLDVLNKAEEANPL